VQLGWLFLPAWPLDGALTTAGYRRAQGPGLRSFGLLKSAKGNNFEVFSCFLNCGFFMMFDDF